MRKRLSQLDPRTAKVGKNILLAFLLKGWGGLLQFLLVPITLGILTQYEYGIWMLISNLLLWLDNMDIGLGNGLRNRLAEALATEDWVKCRKLICTTFITLSCIAIPLIMLFCTIISNVDMYAFLNVDADKIGNLSDIIMMATIMVGVTFIFKCISNVYLALQMPAVSNGLMVAGQTLLFVLLLTLKHFTQLSMFDVILISTISPLVVYIAAFPVTFHLHRNLRPSIKDFDKGCIKSLFGIGLEFFFGQLAGMFLYATSSIIISRLSSPNEVTVYQIAYRYFGIMNILFTVISAPLWSATTDAYVRNDIEWITITMRRMRRVLLGFGMLSILMLIVSNVVYSVWAKGIIIPFEVSLLTAVNIFVIIYSTCYSNFICGIGKVRMCMLVSIAGAVIYIPLAQFCGTVFNLPGIIFTMIVVNLLSAVSNRVQFAKLISGTARGLWNK